MTTSGICKSNSNSIAAINKNKTTPSSCLVRRGFHGVGNAKSLRSERPGFTMKRVVAGGSLAQSIAKRKQIDEVAKPLVADHSSSCDEVDENEELDLAAKTITKDSSSNSIDEGSTSSLLQQKRQIKHMRKKKKFWTADEGGENSGSKKDNPQLDTGDENLYVPKQLSGSSSVVK